MAQLRRFWWVGLISLLWFAYWWQYQRLPNHQILETTPTAYKIGVPHGTTTDQMCRINDRYGDDGKYIVIVCLAHARILGWVNPHGALGFKMNQADGSPVETDLFDSREYLEPLGLRY